MTISLHVAQSTSTRLLYILGHLFGGLFFLIFAYKFFYQQLDSSFLWVISIGGALAEWAQALVLARGKLEIYHNVLAWFMALFMSVLLIAAPVTYGLEGNGLIALIASIFLLASCFVVGLIVGIRRFWIPQIMYFFMFYIVMVILIS